MNIKNKTKLLLLMLIPCVSFAQDGTGELGSLSAEQIHMDSHTNAGATAMYENWKSGHRKSDDPFRRISEGYRLLHDETVQASFQDTVVPTINSYLETSDSSIRDLINERKEVRAARLADAYNESYVDGEFDHETYNSLIESYKVEKRTSSDLFYESRLNRLRQLSVANNSVNATVNEDSAEKVYSASNNIIIQMQNDFTNRRAELYANFSENLTRRRESADVAAETQEIANEWSDECPACTFYIDPQEIVEPEPVPEAPDLEDTPVYNPPPDRCNLYGRNPDMIPTDYYNRNTFYICP